MKAAEYLDYLIDAAKTHAEGRSEIGVQPVELVTLKALLTAEQKQRDAKQ